MTPTENKSSRLFFALWPPAALLPALTDASKAMHQLASGRIIPAENFHVTLLFLGNIDALKQQALIEQMRHIAVPEFSLHFNQCDIWQNGIGSLLCSAMPQSLQQLHEQLKTSAAKLGINTEARQYTPHITLLRRATVQTGKEWQSAINERSAAIQWRVTEFSLVSSEPEEQAAATGRAHSLYRIVQRWPLLQG